MAEVIATNSIDELIATLNKMAELAGEKCDDPDCPDCHPETANGRPRSMTEPLSAIKKKLPTLTKAENASYIERCGYVLSMLGLLISVVQKRPNTAERLFQDPEALDAAMTALDTAVTVLKAEAFAIGNMLPDKSFDEFQKSWLAKHAA